MAKVAVYGFGHSHTGSGIQDFLSHAGHVALHVGLSITAMGVAYELEERSDAVIDFSGDKTFRYCVCVSYGPKTFVCRLSDPYTDVSAAMKQAISDLNEMLSAKANEIPEKNESK